MRKCTCKDCELEAFEENDKCILHCEKDDWYDCISGKKDWSKSENKVEKFWGQFYSDMHILRSECKGYIFPKFEYIGLANAQSKDARSNLFDKKMTHKYIKCVFLDSIELRNKKDYSNDLYFKDCIFKSEIDLSFSEFKGTIEFINSNENTITEKFKIINLSVKNSIFFNDIKIKKIYLICSIFDKTKLKAKVDFYKSIFELTSFKFTEFDDFTIFDKAKLIETYDDSKTIEGKKVNDNKFKFYNTIFSSFIYFKKTIFPKELDLENSVVSNNMNFKDITSNKDIKKDISVSNRETARIIKDSFEQQNNIIEANKFYALEMEKREEELKNDVKKGKNFFEYLVFLFHSLSSNHSQNWLLALFWIISSTFGYTILNCYEFKNNIFFGMWIAVSIIVALGIGLFLKEYIKDRSIHTIFMFVFLFIYYLVYGLILEDFSLYKFSNNLNPFSIMTEFSDLNFLTLIFKITIAYLIYQLIVSIRQNTRRK